MQGTHELLQNTENRHCLARFVFVDATACVICSVLGWQNRKTLYIPVDDRLEPEHKQQKGYDAWHKQAMTYNPAAFRLALWFASYQIKDTIDTLRWDGGTEYLVHHLFTILTAWGSMYPGECAKRKSSCIYTQDHMDRHGNQHTLFAFVHRLTRFFSFYPSGLQHKFLLFASSSLITPR